MIPEIIHFCWFGGNPLPPLALECIASWRKYLPEYEIWMWREKTSPNPSEGREMVADKVMEFDVNSIPYTAEAYKQKKYAFVSDYCRFAAMYEYGGIYFDTDVEVIKSMSPLLTHSVGERSSHYGFMGFEVDPDRDNTPGMFAPRYCFAVNPGVGFGMTAKHPFMKKMVDYYKDMKFELPPANIAWYKTIVAYTTEMLMQENPPLTPPKRTGSLLRYFTPEKYTQVQTVGDNISIYPHEYFAPIDVITGRLHITENTYTIHRYMGSWNNGNMSWKDIVRKLVPSCMFYLNNRIKRHKYEIK